MSERVTEPVILAQDVWVRFLIRYHRREVTLRETFVRLLERLRRRDGLDGRWRKAFWALRGIELRVDAGEVVGVVGPNGAGKTTLLKTLAGIITPDRGRLHVRGRVGCLLSFGVGFNPALSGRENVYLNGSILGLSRREIDQRLEAIIDFAELGPFIDAPVRTYSAGMKGRLGFSIAIHIDPDLLVLDEVLTVGDARFRAKAGSILDRFRRQNKTVVIATHNMELVRSRCTRAIWIENGRIRSDGPPHDVADAYVRSAQPGGVAQPEMPRRAVAAQPSVQGSPSS